MAYLLDTNACIALLNGRPEAVRARFTRAVTKGGTVAVSAIVSFELWYGVGKSARQQFNAARVASFFSGPLDVLPFDDDDAQSAGRLRASLERKGSPIGAYDLLIAGQALARGATLVTANAAEFSRVSGLSWEDWAA
jgi:tRNA(fMet)-specific endonuclease VapC